MLEITGILFGEFVSNFIECFAFERGKFVQINLAFFQLKKMERKYRCVYLDKGKQNGRLLRFDCAQLKVFIATLTVPWREFL